METESTRRNSAYSGQRIERIVFWSGLLALTLLPLVVIASVRFPPLVDYPVHLTLFQAVAETSDSDFSCGESLKFDWFTPYSAVYLPARWLVPLITAEGYAKSLIGWYFILTPLSFIFLLHAAGRPRNYALFIPLMLFNFNFSWGFLPFLAAIPLVFISLALIIRTGDSDWRGWSLLYSLAMLLIFTMHLFAWMIALLLSCAAALATPRSQRLRAIGACVIANLPAGILFFIWRSHLTFSGADEVFLSKKLQIPSPWIKLKYFPDFVISGDPGWGARYVFFAMAGIAIVYMILSVRGKRTVTIRCGIIVFCMVLAYFLCPYSSLTAVWLFNRLAFFVAAASLLLLPTHTRKRVYADGVLILAGLSLNIHMADLYYRFDAEASPAFDCISHATRPERLACIMTDTRSRFTDHSVYDHIDQFAQVMGKGCVINPFALLSHMPIQYPPDSIDEKDRMQIRPGRLPDADQIGYFDAFLVRVTGPEMIEEIARSVSSRGAQPTIRHQSARWVLLGKQEVLR